MTTTSTTDPFRVESVEVAPPPAQSASIAIGDASSGSWCRYVIANRSSRIVGRYRGTMAQTRRNAELLATSFNERVSGNRSAWSPRSKTTGKTARGRGTAAR